MPRKQDLPGLLGNDPSVEGKPRPEPGAQGDPRKGAEGNPGGRREEASPVAGRAQPSALAVSVSGQRVGRGPERPSAPTKVSGESFPEIHLSAGGACFPKGGLPRRHDRRAARGAPSPAQSPPHAPPLRWAGQRRCVPGTAPRPRPRPSPSPSRRAAAGCGERRPPELPPRSVLPARSAPARPRPRARAME
ncbi:translation initiation factor IF-2-like [Camelus ferus]|uniref:Translation initiation factor IF-2-like n=1 Tax=Camelus ferus TaxID=419612 RepID=A0A8B8RJV7_CAMFR|nr:translation initiation factor IF-2-like [Camelus ferus]